MKFLVITNAPTLKENNLWVAYAPYVREMDLWFAHVDQVTLLSPTQYDAPLLTKAFKRQDVTVKAIPAIQLNGLFQSLRSAVLLPILLFKIFTAMKKADHIHLRCPGNIGLLAAVVQILFPKKPKTVKYAGNWDPKASQPWSYKLQKRILSHPKWSKNMEVLVYGQWENQSPNITPFFTASYTQKQLRPTPPFELPQTIHLLFVGSLSSGKRPMYVVQFLKMCIDRGINCRLDIYGDGVERDGLHQFIKRHDLDKQVTLHGNQPSAIIEKAYQNAQFLLLPSRSEGWPKVVAEAMFWGVIPLVTPISCVPWMLDAGNRGILLSLVLEEDVSAFAKALSDPSQLVHMAQNAQDWARQYTLEAFERAVIEKL
ncbi:MAG: glycosyltransferase family 4 protein [Dokdonia sp.]|jgi:glycosyltransferase involved in cell wall biosynthesis|nr:glycosyl transferase [Cytophagaceae bacterium]